MKSKIIILFLSLTYTCLYSQYFGDSGPCHHNVNNGNVWAAGRNDVIAATFKINIDGNCTGTLINRNTDQNSLGYYALIARHCLSRDGLNNDNYVDFNQDYTLYFNYQSPNADNSATFSTNQGQGNYQSYDPAFNPPITNGYEYRHVTKLRKVADYFWGDFALVEILTPIPPHFNVYYAGWTPSSFVSGGVNPPPCNTVNHYAGIHHPDGDIKKISGTNSLINPTGFISTGCNTVTKVIDILLGWLWGRKVSTTVVCNYIDVPWLTVPSWCYGTIEGGSSGSGLFNHNNKYLGPLSGGPDGCTAIRTTTYGKFYGSYPKQAIKNVLNPPNSLGVDVSGMNGRRISCYTNLTLPGAPGVSGEYFPANHYQAGNKIILQAEQYIQTSGHLRIHVGADYEFKSATVTLNPGFKADIGSNFLASPQPCNDGLRIGNPDSKLIAMLSQMDMPRTLEFDYEKYGVNPAVVQSLNEKYSLQVYPNPNNGNFKFDISVFDDTAEMGSLALTDVLGRNVFKKSINFKNATFFSEEISSLPPGIYLLNFSTHNFRKTHKIVVE